MDTKALKEQWETVKRSILAIYDGVENEDRLLSDEEQQDINAKKVELDGLDARIAKAEEYEAIRRELDAKGYGTDPNEGRHDSKGGGALQGGGILIDPGGRLVESDAYKQMCQMFPGGRIPEKARVNSQPVEYKELLTGLSEISAGAFVVPAQTGIYEELGRYALNVLGLIVRVPTGSDTFEWVRQTRKTQEAAPVAESNVTDYTGATGQEEGRKPEATLRYERVTGNVVTISQWLAATKRALADVGQIRSLVNADLMADLMEELAYQIINGDGTGENLTGILNTSGILTQAFDTDLLTTMRRARTAVEVQGLSHPTAVLLHPNDIETIDLLRDSDGRFYYGGPATGGVPQIWGVRVVECQTIPEGYGLMGDFRKARIYDREQATISVSDSHEDFFVRNMVAILAELRAGLAVVRPQAFVVIDLESGS